MAIIAATNIHLVHTFHDYITYWIRMHTAVSDRREGVAIISAQSSRSSKPATADGGSRTPHGASASCSPTRMPRPSHGDWRGVAE